MEIPPVITLSRSLGSGGTEVAFLAARRLGWRFCDRSILRRAAQALGRTPASLRPQEERPSGFLEHVLHLFAIASPEVPFAPPLELPIYSQELFDLERKIMANLAASGPAVIVGRGGFIAFKDHPRALHVRVQADPAFRAQFLVDRHKAPDLPSARQMIQGSDIGRARFIQAISGQNWQNPANFHLVLDTSREGIETCVELLLQASAQRFS